MSHYKQLFSIFCNLVTMPEISKNSHLKVYLVQALMVALVRSPANRQLDICSSLSVMQNQQPWFIYLQVVLKYIEHLRCRIAAPYWLSVHGHHYLSKMQWLNHFFLSIVAAKCIYLSGCDWLLENFRFLYLGAVLYCFLLSSPWNDWPVWFIILIIIIVIT